MNRSIVLISTLLLSTHTTYPLLLSYPELDNPPEFHDTFMNLVTSGNCRAVDTFLNQQSKPQSHLNAFHGAKLGGLIYSPLSLAVSQRLFEMTKFLLEHGADPTIMPPTRNLMRGFCMPLAFVLTQYCWAHDEFDKRYITLLCTHGARLNQVGVAALLCNTHVLAHPHKLADISDFTNQPIPWETMTHYAAHLKDPDVLSRILQTHPQAAAHVGHTQAWEIMEAIRTKPFRISFAGPQAYDISGLYQLIPHLAKSQERDVIEFITQLITASDTKLTSDQRINILTLFAAHGFDFSQHPELSKHATLTSVKAWLKNNKPRSRRNHILVRQRSRL